jgi:hypothetical protein
MAASVEEICNKALSRLGIKQKTAWDGWGYIYDLPTSPVVLMPIAVVAPGYAMRGHDRSSGSPYTIAHTSKSGDAQIILSDLPSAVLYYTTRITDMTVFPLEFEDALTFRLAMEIAMPLNADPRRAEYAAKKYADRMKDAMAGAWNGYQNEDDMPDAEAVQARS